MRRTIYVALVGLAGISAASAACEGNACDKVVMEKRGDGCIWLVNKSDKRIKATLAGPGPIVDLYGNSEAIWPAINGRCMTDIQGRWTANYQ
jgi:hypothetical protein